jgi:hypothetical protein
MRRTWVMVVAACVALCVGLTTTATAKTIGISASPNPASVGDRVRHDVSVGAWGRLDVWVSARGFDRPGSGTLPPGTWSLECCPGQTAGTPAWHFRSASSVAAGAYRFGAVGRAAGLYLSTATVAGASAGVWVRIR